MKKANNQMTIYIKEPDLELYEKASLKGSISSVLASALRQYLSSETTNERDVILQMSKDILEIKETLQKLQERLKSNDGK
jgi:hypothetical protein